VHFDQSQHREAKTVSTEARTMARLRGRLTAKQVATLRPPNGKKRHDFADGGCLYLQTTVARGGHINRSWLLKYEIAFVGCHEKGLGPTYDVSLAEARRRARFHRQQLRDGIDPLTAKRRDDSQS
jgi:hypothetical protein